MAHLDRRCHAETNVGELAQVIHDGLTTQRGWIKIGRDLDVLNAHQTAELDPEAERFHELWVLLSRAAVIALERVEHGEREAQLTRDATSLLC